MKIIVLNGSPKGDVSVTMQYVRFIQNKIPRHELKILNISQRIKAIERNANHFMEIADEIYGRLRFPFRLDHHFYRKNGMYDFPQKDYKSRVRNSIMMLMNRIPSMRKEIYTKRTKTEMIKPLQKVLKQDGGRKRPCIRYVPLQSLRALVGVTKAKQPNNRRI
ncbi:MAG: hypothetical protein JRJ09_08720 [Deltaproteobacteria bacterium]|nr:hypothetical protein [Deltaproteobacteria bacterium]MBW2048597.1 hypothetical protein [Deltaproteobacteria bacterium]MBW2112944.1 hypothetical protein [Deltaproteobacteria bacterium]MBW2353786.1 hypothetical protein [Deltaproteobacteria bacterium]